jgi:hypothetical protein
MRVCPLCVSAVVFAGMAYWAVAASDTACCEMRTRASQPLPCPTPSSAAAAGGGGGGGGAGAAARVHSRPKVAVSESVLLVRACMAVPGPGIH